MDALSKHVWLSALVLVLQSAVFANPTPWIDGISPTAVSPGSPDTVLTIRGAGFAPGATVRINRLTLTPGIITPGVITVTLPASSLTAPISATVQILNSSAPVPTSNVAYLRIREPSPSAFLADSASIAGKPGFAPPAQTIIPGDGYLISTADFNNDGNIDVLIGAITGTSSKNALYLGNGKGKFGSPISLPDMGPYSKLLVNDLNGDGNLDLVAFNSEPTYKRTAVLLGDGQGGFTINQTLFTSQPNPDYPEVVAVADVTGDGVPDLIGSFTDSSAHATSIRVFPGLGDGRFSESGIDSAIGFLSSVLAVGDFTGDGTLDVEVRSLGLTWSVYQGAGDGHFSRIGSGFSSSDAFTNVVKDLNADGKLDIALGGFGNAHVAINQGGGNFRVESIPVDKTSSFGNFSGAEDVNGDGKIDLFDDEAFYLGSGTGQFSRVPQFYRSQELDFLSVADFDGDGRVDVLLLKNDFHDSTKLDDYKLKLFMQVPETQPAEFADSVSFGSNDVGLWIGKYIPVTNRGTSTLYLTGVELTPASQTGPLDFGAQLNTCVAGIPPGGSCNLNVTYHPAVIGPAQAGLTLLGNMTGTLPNTALFGTGSQCENFKQVAVGKTASLDFPMTAKGPSIPTEPPLSISGAIVTPFPGTPAEDFHLEATVCSDVISQWASLPNSYGLIPYCHATVAFRPSRAGYEFAILHVYTAYPTPGWRVLYLFGEGLKK